MAFHIVDKVFLRILGVRRMMQLLPEMESGGDREERARQEERIVENIMKTAEMHLVVATLLMTVTFTAGFTLPGGFDSDTDSHNKGMAILIKKAVFRAFFVTNAIAFVCSSAAVFTYFSMETNTISSEKEFSLIVRLYMVATMLQLLSTTAVVIAFATGMYVTLAHSVGIAVTVAVMGSFSLYMLLGFAGSIGLKKKKHTERNQNRAASVTRGFHHSKDNVFVLISKSATMCLMLHIISIYI
ncbi:hypothetical protein P3L10_016480 [Capsicum annuum]